MGSSPDKRDWTFVLKELHAPITKCLLSRIDILRLRAVCRSVREAVAVPQKPLSPHTALKIPLPPGANPDLSGHLLLNQSVVYAVEPLNKMSNPNKTTKTWLVKIEELSGSAGKVRVKDPFHWFSYDGLSKKLPKSLNLLDYRVTEITKAYGLEYIHVDKGKAPDDINFMNNVFFKKVAVSSSLDEIDDGFVVIGIWRGGKLLMWRNLDGKWTNIEIYSRRIVFEDVVYHNGRFYAQSYKGPTFSVECKSFEVTEVAVPVAYGDYKYLVSSMKGLFLVDKQVDVDGEFDFMEESEDENYPIHLNVFKLNKEKGNWIELVDSLEDCALFCGYDCSFSVLAKEFSGCKKNCVYFPDDSFDEASDDHPGWDAGIFNIGDGTIGKLADFSGHSMIFWPPPTWLNKNSSLTLC